MMARSGLRVCWISMGVIFALMGRMGLVRRPAMSLAFDGREQPVPIDPGSCQACEGQGVAQAYVHSVDLS